jgi:DNA-binding PadR family transcriptional regulator
MEDGDLRSALQRMLRRGWIRSEWRVSENNRRARYYVLTRGGRAELANQAALWKRASDAVDGILRARLAGNGA